MTIDKIEKNLPSCIFKYWTTLIDYYYVNTVIERMQSAKKQLEYEIENNLNIPTYYIYELKLLNHLLS
jgi:hypothetical protein